MNIVGIGMIVLGLILTAAGVVLRFTWARQPPRSVTIAGNGKTRAA